MKPVLEAAEMSASHSGAWLAWAAPLLLLLLLLLLLALLRSRRNGPMSITGSEISAIVLAEAEAEAARACPRHRSGAKA